MRTTLVVVSVLVVLAALAAIAYSGAYNVAADEPHWALTQRTLEIVRDRSIQTRARDLSVPDLAEDKRIRFGAGQYAEMCESCHLAPGLEESELSRGLYPKPPQLSRHRMDPREAFWIIKHGLKMTGMPAWGPTHGDDVLWSVVAFLQKLPELDDKGYRELAGKQESPMPMSDGGHGGEHSHSHGTRPHSH